MEKDIQPKGQMSETSAVVETYSSNACIHTTLKHSDCVSMVDNYDSDYEVICDLDDKMSIESSKKVDFQVFRELSGTEHGIHTDGKMLRDKITGKDFFSTFAETGPSGDFCNNSQ